MGVTVINHPMEKKLTYTFTFTIDGKTYSFNVVAETEEAALLILRADLAKIIADINFDKK